MGRLDLAMAIFLDLRQFDEAKRWAEELTRDQGDSEIVRDLMLRQAEWFEEAGDHSAAAEMYRTARKYDRAVHILTRSELWEPLSELCRGLPAKELKPLTMAAEALRKAGRVKEAREIFTKLQDFRSVAQILVDGGLWDEAHELMQVRPEVKEIVMLPYATWLALQDRFDEARVAYKAAGKPEASVHVLEQLAHNGVVECRFADAAFYFYHLAMEALGSVQNPADRMTSADRRALDRYADMYHRAELYYAYDFVHRSVDDPFCRTDASVLFDISRYLLMRILQRTELQRKEAPLGISLVNIILVRSFFQIFLSLAAAATCFSLHLPSKYMHMHPSTTTRRCLNLSCIIKRMIDLDPHRPSPSLPRSKGPSKWPAWRTSASNPSSSPRRASPRWSWPPSASARSPLWTPRSCSPSATAAGRPTRCST